MAVVLKFVVTRRLLAWGVLRSATGGCLCFLGVKWCRPSANVERRVKISLTALFVSELRRDIAARTDGDSQASGGPDSPGWCFSATGLEIGEGSSQVGW